MQRSRQSDLALDADQPGPPHVRLRGDPARLGKRIIPELNDGEAVHLADRRPGRVDKEPLFRNLAVEMLLEQVGPIGPLINRSAHVVRFDGAAAALLRPKSRFADDVGHDPETGYQPALRSCQTRAVLDHLADRLAIEMAQPLLVAPGRDETGELVLVLRCPIHLDVKVRAHLEQLAEILLQRIETVIQRRAPHQDDLEF